MHSLKMTLNAMAALMIHSISAHSPVFEVIYDGKSPDGSLVERGGPSPLIPNQCCKHCLLQLCV